MRTILTMLAVAATLVTHASAQDVYKAGDPGVRNPRLTREVKPKYTDGAMQRRVEGFVEMDAVVKSDGTVGEVSITRSLDAELDQQAMNALREWKFEPGTKDGHAVNVRVNVEMTFSLRKK